MVIYLTCLHYEKKKHTKYSCPTNNALLINFRLSSDAEILLIISTDSAYKSVPNV